MAKLTFLLLFVFSFTSTLAQQFSRVELVFNDGRVKSGYAQSVLEANKKLKFRETEKGETSVILLNELKSATYFLGSDTSRFERHDYFPAIQAKKAQKDGWFLLLRTGYVSLYFVQSTLGGGVNPATGMHNGSASFKEYFVIRPNEVALMKISTVASLNSNATFKMYAPRYFSDYPELAEKIKNKEYTYKDLEEVLDIYNAWIAQKQ